MKTIILLSILLGTDSIAALSIKPGLWNIETKIKKDGKEYDPQAQIKSMMAKMSPEQKKQMQAMISKMGKGASSLGFGDQGIQVCFSNEMIKNEEFLNQHKVENCDVKFPVKTSNRVVTEFKCKNGSSGTAEWNVKDSTHYQGAVKMKDQKGESSEIKYVGVFASDDCGKVKPIDALMSKKPAKK